MLTHQSFFSPFCAVAATLCSSLALAAGSAGHAACEMQFKRFGKGQVTAVPDVRDWGDSREYYFAWNAGSQSQLLQTSRGQVSGSCVIDRKTGEGFITLNGKDLGSFRVKAPL